MQQIPATNDAFAAILAGWSVVTWDGIHHSGYNLGVMALSCPGVLLSTATSP